MAISPLLGVGPGGKREFPLERTKSYIAIITWDVIIGGTNDILPYNMT